MYRSILVPVDGSAFAEHALPVALAIAERSRATTTLVRAWDPANYRDSSELTPPFLEAGAPERLAASDYLNAVAGRLRAGTTVPIDVALLAGRAGEAIGHYLTHKTVDLVVMTTHGLTGWNRAWIGSVADSLVRRVTAPVLLCRPLEHPSELPAGKFGRVVLPLDGSAEAEQILTHAAAIGDASRFILVRVIRPVTTPVHPYAYAAPTSETDYAATDAEVARARAYLVAIAKSIEAEHPGATVDVDVIVAERTAAAVVDAALKHGADLVALTTHARRGVRLVLGSVADKVLRGTHGSVLLLRPAERPAGIEESSPAGGTAVSGKT